VSDWRRANGLKGAAIVAQAAKERYHTALAAATSEDEILELKKTRAHKLVLRAIYNGELVPLQQCEVCSGPSLCGRQLASHHHKGYDEEHIFDVVWLCEACHIRAHPARGPEQHTQSTKDQISKTLKEAYTSGQRSTTAQGRPGDKNPFFGKHHSEETRARLRKPKPKVKCPICQKITSPCWLYRHGCEVPLVAGRRRTDTYLITQ
jgi:hypothetical protein